jgi:cytidine deaminase
MDRLIAAALEARERARAPFSGFCVGAALEEDDGRVFAGCNVESASYGLTMCAERVAAFRAVAEGGRRYRRIVVAADTETLTPPCGACRQVLWELCGDVEVVLMNLRGSRETMRLSTLLPRPFDAKFLD